jgi:hypothetical protein
MRIFLKNLVSVFGLKTLKFFDADPDLGSRILSTLDPGSGLVSLVQNLQKVLHEIRVEWCSKFSSGQVLFDRKGTCQITVLDPFLRV